MKELLIIIISSILVDNFVLSKFLGICPFLGVSKKLSTAAGMGGAVPLTVPLDVSVGVGRTWEDAGH